MAQAERRRLWRRHHPPALHPDGRSDGKTGSLAHPDPLPQDRQSWNCSRRSSPGSRRARSSTGTSRANPSSTGRSRWRPRRWRASMPAPSSSAGRSRSWSSCATTWPPERGPAAAHHRRQRDAHRPGPAGDHERPQGQPGPGRRFRAGADAGHQGRRLAGRAGAPRSTEEPLPTITTGGAAAEDHPGCARPMLVQPFHRHRGAWQ
jgi:hypothetical protein